MQKLSGRMSTAYWISVSTDTLCSEITSNGMWDSSSARAIPLRRASNTGGRRGFSHAGSDGILDIWSVVYESMIAAYLRVLVPCTHGMKFTRSSAYFIRSASVQPLTLGEYMGLAPIAITLWMR